MIYNQNNDEAVGPVLSGKNIWIRSSWGIDGVNSYFYSLDGKVFVPFGSKSQLTWGSYRGDRIGIFNYNIQSDEGFVDVDFFQYHYSR